MIKNAKKGSGTPLPLKFWLSLLTSAALIEGGVAGVEVLGIEVILGDAEGIGKALIMHDLALAQEFDDVVDVGIVREAKDIVVGGSRLLLGGEVLVEIGQNIALYADVFHIKGHSRGGNGVEPCGMVNEVGRKRTVFYLLNGEIACQLIKDRGYHLEVRELLCAHIGQDTRYLVIRAGIALMQITHRRGELTVGASKLQKDIIISHIKEQFYMFIGFVKHYFLNNRF